MPFAFHHGGSPIIRITGDTATGSRTLNAWFVHRMRLDRTPRFSRIFRDVDELRPADNIDDRTGLLAELPTGIEIDLLQGWIGRGRFEPIPLSRRNCM
jgi:hypothetical protein